MIEFSKFTLGNGLRVIVHEDRATPLVSLNIVYNVGAKHESPDQTGFAHLFEHLMFGGSVNIPSFDNALQLVGGQNNAFTSNDLTNYYQTLPAENLETAFWLESDRMLCLDFSEKSLSVQKSVVIEEFKQRYLNQPYGDVWLNLRPLAYKVHPYQWPTIGKEISHIENANLQNVKDFFFKHYGPDNAILVVAGNTNEKEVRKLAEKWFGPIENRNIPSIVLPKEPVQTDARYIEISGKVPYNAIYKAYHMPGKHEPGYYAADLISDILSNGNSSRLYQNLIMKGDKFGDINCYILGSHDPGLIVFTGNLNDGVKMEDAEKALEEQIDKMISDPIEKEELEKVKNKVEATITFSRVNVLNKAMALAFAELLGNAEDVNKEVEHYRNVSESEIRDVASKILRKGNCSTLYYTTDKEK